jgi:hypothetical protein
VHHTFSITTQIVLYMNTIQIGKEINDYTVTLIEQTTTKEIINESIQEVQQINEALLQKNKKSIIIDNTKDGYDVKLCEGTETIDMITIPHNNQLLKKTIEALSHH